MKFIYAGNECCSHSGSSDCKYSTGGSLIKPRIVVEGTELTQSHIEQEVTNSLTGIQRKAVKTLGLCTGQKSYVFLCEHVQVAQSIPCGFAKNDFIMYRSNAGKNGPFRGVEFVSRFESETDICDNGVANLNDAFFDSNSNSFIFSSLGSGLIIGLSTALVEGDPPDLSFMSLWVTLRQLRLFFINLSGIRVFGEFELLFFSIKVAALTYWSHDDGIHYRPRRFVFYTGTELAGINMGETEDRGRNFMQRAILSYFGALYGGAFVVSLTVPNNNSVHGTALFAASKSLAGVADTTIRRRTFYGLAAERKASRMFAKVNRAGIRRPSLILNASDRLLLHIPECNFIKFYR
ncbi:hypothetical protein BDR07DRAFT_1464266 [Suillus spraguei]|nr:hypothetical protein BDR07DRAFT_1464266 [Suillus spraguei]